MMFVEFIRYYQYTADQALNEYAKRFFALISMMYRQQAKEAMTDMAIAATTNADAKERQKVFDSYQEQYKGKQKILEEVRNIKR